MANRFDGRVTRLEALCADSSILDEFDSQQQKALFVYLSVLDEDEPIDEILSRVQMSRESCEAALASIPPGLSRRFVEWAVAQDRAMENAEEESGSS